MKTIEQKRKQRLDEIEKLKIDIAEKTAKLDRLLGFIVTSKEDFQELPGGNYSEEVFKIFQENPEKKLDSVSIKKLLDKKYSLNLDKGKVYSAIHYLKTKGKIAKSDQMRQFILLQ